MLIHVMDRPGCHRLDSGQHAIMLTLSDREKELISSMGGQRHICFYPEGSDRGEIRIFMQDNIMWEETEGTVKG